MPSHRADTPASRRRTTDIPSPSSLGPAPLPTRRSLREAERPARRSAPRSTARPAAPAPRGGSGSRPARPARPHRSPSQLSAPQVGIAGALGLATIAAPISGAMASPPPKAQVNAAASVVSMAPAPAFPALSVQRAIGVETRSVLPATDLPTTSTPSLLASRPILVTGRASRANERSILPGCVDVGVVTDAPNGQIPLSSLCTLWDPDHRLRSDAAIALAKLNIAYKQEFGDDVCLTDSYRTYSSQVRLKSTKPGLAATPGTSEHGWGLAVDLCDGIQKGSGSRFQWMRDNAADYGWENPDWARSGGSGPYEPWHWEYQG